LNCDKTHIRKRALLLVLPVLAVGIALGLSYFRAKADTSYISIITEAPAVGLPLEAEITAGTGKEVTVLWYKQKEKIGEGTQYYPTAADYECFIRAVAVDADGKELAEDEIYFSKLPVVYINTKVAEESIDRTEYVGGTMTIQGNRDYAAQYEGKIKLKGRGSSSWRYDKKPYKIKLDKKTNLFGFGENKHYCLLANYLDPSLLRNTVGYRLSSLLGLCATDTVWVEVVMNGEYRGCYQLCEHVRVGSQLVDVFDWEDYASDVAEWIAPEDGKLEDRLTEDLSWVTEDAITYKDKDYLLCDFEGYQSSVQGGYLLELDSEDNKEISGFVTNNGIKVHVSKPEYLCTNETMMKWLEDTVAEAEDALCAEDGYSSQGRHYTELIDFDSMVNYWLCMELLANEDGSQRSRFCSIDVGGKIVFGPVWDFDISSGSFRSYYGTKGWAVTASISGWYEKQDFWKDMVDDPYFQMKARERYWQIRPVMEELIQEDGIIDNYVEYLYEAACANELLWTGDGFMTRSFTGDQGDVEIYRSFLKERLAWMDTVFSTEDSTVKNLYSVLSNNPYRRSDSMTLTLDNATVDTSLYGGDYVMEEATDILLRVKAGAESEITFYVNGLKADITRMDGTLNEQIYRIPATCFTEEEGSLNVITVRAGSGFGEEQNFVTVTVGNTPDYPFEKTVAEAFCLPSESECTTHILTKVEERTADDTSYGIDTCWYCSVCQSYFADEEGCQKLSAGDIISSAATSDKPGGIPLTVNELLIIVIGGLSLLVVALPVLLIFCIKKRIRKNQNRSIKV